VSVGCVADDEDTAVAKSVGDDAFHRPDRHGVNLGCEIGHAQQRLHSRDDLLAVTGVRVAVGIADVENPFLGLRAPIARWRRKRGTGKWHVYTFIADRPIRSVKVKIRALDPQAVATRTAAAPVSERASSLWARLCGKTSTPTSCRVRTTRAMQRCTPGCSCWT
jgi:hypothetical protein